MINRVILIGRLTKDADNKTSTSGVTVTSFTLAVERSFKTADGQREVDYLNIVAFRGLAEICGKYLHKGDLAAVEGRIQIDKYTDKDGQNRTTAKIIADNVQFLSPPKREAVPAPTEPTIDFAAAQAAYSDEEVPF